MLAPEGTGGGLPPGVGVGVGVDVSGGNWKGGCPGKGEGGVPGRYARGKSSGGPACVQAVKSSTTAGKRAALKKRLIIV